MRKLNPFDTPVRPAPYWRGRTHRVASRQVAGFTLIEVLIAVAIVGIVAALAVPSYSGYLTKARRSDATIFLTEAAGEQVRHFSEFNAYTDDLTELGYAAATALITPDGHYSVSATLGAGPGPGSFTLTATPVAGSSQANDTACGSFTLSSTGARGSTSGSPDCW